MALTGYRVPDIIAVLKLINDNGKDMTTTDFGMFTDNGNILVQGIVDVAKSTDADWPWVYEKLEMLAKTKGFEEATDTMVREIVFDAIGYSNDTPFYI
jgi:hypothetical protein